MYLILLNLIWDLEVEYVQYCKQTAGGAVVVRIISAFKEVEGKQYHM